MGVPGRGGRPPADSTMGFEQVSLRVLLLPKDIYTVSLTLTAYDVVAVALAIVHDY